MTAKLINGVLELEIRDRGEGLPVSAVNGKTTSLGLRIVKRLAKQIEATFTLDGSNEGTSFRISTKLDNPLLD
jgi:two-component sensor histidine kinase